MSDPKERLYVVVRRDLAPGLQFAQAIHAAIGLTKHSPLDLEEQTLAVCWADDAAGVEFIRDVCDNFGLQARPYGHDYYVWREPDLNDEVTALAIAPSYAAKRICAGLPAAFSV